METKDIILELRTKKGMSQEELAEKVFVTRQAVSRWETGETVPNTETLKQLSKLFDVSINTLLGSPRQLVCECCGMPIDDSNVSHEKDGAFNEDYCKWCYADGEYTLDFFEKYRELGGKEEFEKFKQIRDEERAKQEVIRQEEKRLKEAERELKRKAKEIERQELAQKRMAQRGLREAEKENRRNKKEALRMKQKEEARIKEEILEDNLYPKTKYNKDI